MGKFKVIKKEAPKPQFSEFIQRRVDIAGKYDSTYELDDEDMRIDRLFKNENLTHQKKLKGIDRIMVDGQEYVIPRIEYQFYGPSGKNVVDRFVDDEGKIVVPIAVEDPNTGEFNNSPLNNILYGEEYKYSPQKVTDLINQYGRPGELRFYNGGARQSRPMLTPPYEVKNLEFFKNATWDELVSGKEFKYTSMSTNRLGTLRKNLIQDNGMELVALSSETKTDIPKKSK
jgi:hypothetical protein